MKKVLLVLSVVGVLILIFASVAAAQSATGTASATAAGAQYAQYAQYAPTTASALPATGGPSLAAPPLALVAGLVLVASGIAALVLAWRGAT